MKAAVLNTNNGMFCIEDVQIAVPEGREVFVEVKASGWCHSDLYLAEHDYGIPLPAEFGHELAGIVRKVGPDVRKWQVGDHVVGSLVLYCGHCEVCIEGRTYQCSPSEETLRDSANGQRLTRNGDPVTQAFGTAASLGMRCSTRTNMRKCSPSPLFRWSRSGNAGASLGAGAAINRAGVNPGDTVAVIGVGGVEFNVIHAARLTGAQRIAAIDMRQAKEALARKFGATDFIDPSQGDAVERGRALVGGGVDHAFEAIGLKSTSEQAVKMVRKGGGFYLIGMQKPDSPINVDVTNGPLMNQVGDHEWRLNGIDNIERDIPMYAELYLQRRFNLDDLISREIGIDEINNAYQELKTDVIARSVITSF